MIHTITANINHKFVPVSLTDFELACLTVQIKFNYTPGAPDSYDAARGGPGGWDPGYPPEVELVEAKLIDGDGLEPTQAQLDDIVNEWLQDDGFGQCVSAIIDNEGGL